MKSSTVILVLLVTALFTSCGNPESDPATAEMKKPLSLMDLKKDFKYGHLDQFVIDTFNWDTRPQHYKELDSTSFYLVWQDKKREFIGQGADRDYLFSWQNRDTSFIEFTILWQDESSYCDNITYCIYDKQGKVIDSFIAVSSCGDGGWSFRSSGKFIEKNIFEQTCIEISPSDVDSEREVATIDSTIYRYAIGPTGKVTTTEIFKARHTE